MNRNRITTKQTLEKIVENLQSQKFKKEFNKLFKDYINIKNVDQTAYYHKFLEILENAGMSKDEAEDFFKNLRVKNSRLIQQVQDLQKQKEELERRWKEEKVNLIINPLNMKSFVSVVILTLEDFVKKFAELEKQLELQFSNNLIIKEKLEKVKQILDENIKQLKDAEKDNNVLAVNKVVSSLEKVVDETQKIVTENITNNITQELLSQNKEQQQKSIDEILVQEKEQRQKGKEKETTLQEALNNSINSILNSLDREIDEKTLNFLVLSEFLHNYSSFFSLKDVFENFKNVFDKKEFTDIVLYNKALMNNDVENIIDFAKEEGFEAVKIEEYAQMLRHNFAEYAELEKEIENKLEPEKLKKLEIQQPTIHRNLDLTI